MSTTTIIFIMMGLLLALLVVIIAVSGSGAPKVTEVTRTVHKEKDEGDA